MTIRVRVAEKRLRPQWARMATACLTMGVASWLYHPNTVGAQVSAPPVAEAASEGQLASEEVAAQDEGNDAPTEADAVVVKRAFVSGINRFTTAGGGCFNEQQLDNSRKGAEAVATELTAKGWTVSTKHGTTALWRHWTDKTRTGNQASSDESFADKADLAYVSTHGSYRKDANGNTVGTVFLTGKKDSNLGCEIRMFSDVRWGDSAMDIVAVDACWSLDYWAFSRGMYDLVSRINDVTIALGFNGLSSDSIKHRDAVKDWIKASSNGPIAKNWVDKLTMTQTTGGVTRTDCAVAIIWAVDRTEADLIYNNDNLGNYQPSEGGTAFYYFRKDCKADQATELTFEPPRWRRIL